MSEPAQEMSAEEYHAWLAGRRSHKYGAVPVEIDGIRFDSTAEGTRYWELRQLERAGEIDGLELQPVFPLVVNGVTVAQYRGDFRYRDRAGAVHVEDVKGVRTPVYRLKTRMVRAIYGIEIEEIAR